MRLYAQRLSPTDVSDVTGANSSDALKQKDEGAAKDSSAANALDGLAW
jgi:hypothetical protein